MYKVLVHDLMEDQNAMEVKISYNNERRISSCPAYMTRWKTKMEVPFAHGNFIMTRCHTMQIINKNHIVT